MMMRYHLALVPDDGNGNPDFTRNMLSQELPEGVNRLSVEAAWSLTEDKSFTGGVSSFTIDLAKADLLWNSW